MIIILVLVIGAVIGVAVGVGLYEDTKRSATDTANAARRADVEQAYQQVLALFSGKSEITNDDVQEALGVSDATATNYLDVLEHEGRIEQVGSTGRGVVYRKK